MKRNTASNSAIAPSTSVSTTENVSTVVLPTAATGKKSTKAPATVKSLSRTKAIDLIKNPTSNGFFSIMYVKGSAKGKPQPRLLTTIKKNAPADAKIEDAPKIPRNSNLAAMGYLTVWDHFAKGWRAVDTRTITQVKMGNVINNVRK